MASASSSVLGAVPGMLTASLDYTAKFMADMSELYRTEAARSGSNPRMHAVAILSIAYFLYKLALFFPLFRNRKLPSGLKGHIIAHRGSREEGLPENTVAAFKDAVAAGAHIVELDVWMTTDGKIVVHHDETLTRMTQGACLEKIHTLDYASLPKIDPITPQNERVKAMPAARRSEWECIPLLEDVLAVIPEHVGVIVEFKQDSDRLIDLVHTLVTKTLPQRKENMYWFSLSEGINAKLRAKDASIPTIISATSVLKVLLWYYLGLLPFCALPDAVFGITMDEITLEKVRSEKALKPLPDWVKRLVAYALSGKPSGMMIAPGLFAHLRKRGVPVWFLGCDTDEDLKVAIKAGATAVLTDRVNWLCKLSSQHGLRFHSIREPSV